MFNSSAHRGLRHAHRTDTRLAVSFGTASLIVAVYYFLHQHILQLWSYIFARTSVWAGAPSVLLPSRHTAFLVESAVFIPRTGIYHWVPFIFAAVLFAFAFFFRISRLPLSITLFSLAIIFLISGLFMTPHRLHLLQLGAYLQTLFSFSFEIIPYIFAILCITGFIIPGSLSCRGICSLTLP